MKVLIVVTHLLGTGHLSRALTLGRAFAGDGHVVTIASGGMPAPQLDYSGITLLQLPALRSDGTNFTRLLDTNGQEAGPATMQARRTALINALGPAPDILITELFPFGRRVLGDEFLALLEAASALPHHPVILASIRDILAPPSRPSKATRTDEIIARFYDAVLVHSDPRGTPLEQSWPVSGPLRAKLRYTGYVAPPPSGPHPEHAGQGEILVSAGGGAVGTRLFETAIAAAHLMPARRWRLLVGAGDTPARIEALKAQSPAADTIIEPARPDFRQMLYHADASVSMCGYNTTLDLLQGGTNAVLVPFDAGQEVEQGLRAQSLAALPSISILRSADLTPRALCDAVEQVTGAPPRADTGLGFDGAAQTVALATSMAKAHK
jgi:predicted glycosyltransferase